MSELVDCAAATGILTCAMLKMSRIAKKRPERLPIISGSRKSAGAQPVTPARFDSFTIDPAPSNPGANLSNS